MQHVPALTLTRTATAALAAATFVGFSGGQTAAGEKPLGVARFAAGKAGDDIPVDVLGTAIVRAGAAFDEGNAIEVGADGKAVPAAAGVTAGYAMQDAAAADQLVEVLLTP